MMTPCEINGLSGICGEIDGPFLIDGIAERLGDQHLGEVTHGVTGSGDVKGVMFAGIAIARYIVAERERRYVIGKCDGRRDEVVVGGKGIILIEGIRACIAARSAMSPAAGAEIPCIIAVRAGTRPTPGRIVIKVFGEDIESVDNDHVYCIGEIAVVGGDGDGGGSGSNAYDHAVLVNRRYLCVCGLKADGLVGCVGRKDGICGRRGAADADGNAVIVKCHAFNGDEMMFVHLDCICTVGIVVERGNDDAVGAGCRGDDVELLTIAKACAVVVGDKVAAVGSNNIEVGVIASNAVGGIA